MRSSWNGPSSLFFASLRIHNFSHHPLMREEILKSSSAWTLKIPLLGWWSAHIFFILLLISLWNYSPSHMTCNRRVRRYSISSWRYQIHFLSQHPSMVMERRREKLINKSLKSVLWNLFFSHPSGQGIPLKTNLWCLGRLFHYAIM